MNDDTNDPIDMPEDDIDELVDGDDEESPSDDGSNDEEDSSKEGPSQKGEENGQVHNGGTNDRPESTEKEPPIDFSRKSRANSDEAGFAKARMKDFYNFYRTFGDHVGRDKFEAAQDMFFGDHVGGGKFGAAGDINFNFGPSTTSKTPNDPGFEMVVDFEEVLATFVSHNRTENALQLLQQHGALVISGPSGNGRRTLAYYLMHHLEKIGPNGIAFRQLPNINPLLEPSEETFAQFETHRVYVLPPDASLQKGLNKKRLEQLAARMCQKQSYLIIIWQEVLTWSLKVPWHIHLGAQALPRPTEVFQKHLAYLLEQHQLSISDEELQQLLNRPEISSLLSEALSLRRIVGWAKFVAFLLKDGKSVTEIVQQCQQQQVVWLRQDALELVRTAPSPAHLCLRVAAAVMSNIHVNAFQELADHLQKALNKSFDRKSRKTWREFWNGPRSHWLDVAHAKVEPMMEWIDKRRVRADVMKTVPEMLSIPLIEAFWEEYPNHQKAFLGWLELCGRHKNFHVRFAAARAISVLYLRNPHRIEKPIIISWAKNEHFALQESAAMSLAMACSQSPSTMQATRKLLKKWRRISEKNRQVKIENLDGDKLELFFASAIVYAWLGIDSPQEFIKGIRELVSSRDILFYRETDIRLTETATLRVRTKEGDTVAWRLNTVRFACQRFLQLSELEPSDDLMLLGQMLKWTKSNSYIQRLIGRIVFVDLILVEEAPNVMAWEEQEREFAPTRWPVLLRIMQRTKQAPVIAARLFEETTDSRKTQLAAWAGLKGMIIFAGKEPEARPLLKRFIYTLIANSKRSTVVNELKHRLRHWAKTSNSAAKPAPYSKNLLVWLYDNHLLQQQ